MQYETQYPCEPHGYMPLTTIDGRQGMNVKICTMSTSMDNSCSRLEQLLSKYGVFLLVSNEVASMNKLDGTQPAY